MPPSMMDSWVIRKKRPAPSDDEPSDYKGKRKAENPSPLAENSGASSNEARSNEKPSFLEVPTSKDGQFRWRAELWLRSQVGEATPVEQFVNERKKGKTQAKSIPAAVSGENDEATEAIAEPSGGDGARHHLSFRKKSIHQAWDDIMETLYGDFILTMELEFQPTRGYRCIVSYVISLYAQTLNCEVIDEKDKAFYYEVNLRDVVEEFSSALVSGVKQLLESDVSATFGDILNAGERSDWKNDFCQGCYFIGVRKSRKADRLNEGYGGSTFGLKGFAGRMWGGHQNPRYRELHPRTPVYQSMERGESYEARRLLRLPPRWSQSRSWGSSRVIIFESMIAAFFGTYPAHQCYRTAGESQFSLGWWGNGSLPTREDLEQIEIQRGYAGLNRSIPYYEMHMSQSGGENPWPQLLEGIHVSVDSDMCLWVGACRFRFQIRQEHHQMMRDNRVERVQLQVHIASEGKAHEHQYAELPEPFDDEWEQAASLAMSASFAILNANPPKSETIWLHAARRASGLTAVRATKLGRAMFCMSVIEHVQGLPQLPAGPRRVDLTGTTMNTDEPKIWEVSTDMTDKSIFGRRRLEFIHKNTLDSVFKCPYCVTSVEKGAKVWGGPSEQGHHHIDGSLDCRKALMTDLGMSAEEQALYIPKCEHCDREFPATGALVKHWQSNDQQKCRDAENKLRATTGEPLIVRPAHPCEWCGQVFQTIGLLNVHLNDSKNKSCKVNEDRKREANGEKATPSARHVCPTCGRGWASPGEIRGHISGLKESTCLRDLNKLRHDSGDVPIAPDTFFCQEIQCKENLEFFGRVEHLNRHYGAVHKGVDPPSKEAGQFLPKHHAHVLRKLQFSSGEDAVVVLDEVLERLRAEIDAKGKAKVKLKTWGGHKAKGGKVGSSSKGRDLEIDD